eukprot:scaffold1355_cov268-Pinguiococcus_pyrenoidosus.AAC.1
MEHALVGLDLNKEPLQEEFTELQGRPLLLAYKKLSDRSYQLVESTPFQVFITVVIVMAGILAGVGSYESVRSEAGDVLVTCDWIILGIFVLEFVLKIVAEEFQPLHVFANHWNKFDFVVIVGSALPEEMTGGFVSVLRLLRLLRVMKLVSWQAGRRCWCALFVRAGRLSQVAGIAPPLLRGCCRQVRALPQLQVIVTALIMGFQSITCRVNVSPPRCRLALSELASTRLRTMTRGTLGTCTGRFSRFFVAPLLRYDGSRCLGKEHA